MRNGAPVGAAQAFGEEEISVLLGLLPGRLRRPATYSVVGVSARREASVAASGAVQARENGEGVTAHPCAAAEACGGDSRSISVLLCASAASCTNTVMTVLVHDHVVLISTTWISCGITTRSLAPCAAA